MTTLPEKQAEKIIFLLQNLFILEAKTKGLKSEDVRNLLGISNNELFKIWKLININKNKKASSEQ
jgi:hypothetical protein